MTEEQKEKIRQRNKLLKQAKKGFNKHYIRHSVVYIILNDGSKTLCDKEDLELVSKFRWCNHNSKGCHYAQSTVKIPDQKKTKSYWMHQVIMGGKNIDHINGNGLDNRRCNLRFYDYVGQNAVNSHKRKNNTTGYIGVTYHRGVYDARISFHGKRIHLGSFKTKEEAAKARDEAIKKVYGEFAKLNF